MGNLDYNLVGFRIQRTLQKTFFSLVPNRKLQHSLRERFFFERRADKEWEFLGATDLVFESLETIKKRKLWRAFPVHSLILVQCLIERGLRKEAAESLEKYVSETHGDLSQICRILPVAEFATTLGIRDALIERAANLNKILSSFTGKFSEIIRGKSVAVVGNAPTEIGSCHGELIDSYDIVCRCNNFKTKGFEKDYGRRCDVWIKTFERDIKHDKRSSSFSLILYRNNFLHSVISGERELEIMGKDAMTTAIAGMDSRSYAYASRWLTGLPTTGFLLLESVLKEAESVKSIGCFGFSFLKGLKGYQYGLHYAENRDIKTAKNITKAHDFGEEGNILRRDLGNCKCVRPYEN